MSDEFVPIDAIETAKLYRCKRECFDAGTLYEPGHTYPIDPASDVAAHFDIPDEDRPVGEDEEAGAGNEGGDGDPPAPAPAAPRGKKAKK